MRWIFQRVRRRVRELLKLPPPDEPPDVEPALVPVGSPRGPRPSLAAAAEPPPPDEDVDAVGREG
jgi:hypothetical protein